MTAGAPLSTESEVGFEFDAESLRALASDAIVRRGIAYFKEDRVVDLGWDDTRVWASVEGSRPDSPYSVQLERDGDEVLCFCDCPFDWEPVCKHAVATLLAYGARQPASDRALEGAADLAVDARVRRAQTEVAVVHVDGEPTFGTWEARSLASTSTSRAWRVDIRSTVHRINCCTCPDFATNRLGTCKHIEAVLHRLAKRRKKADTPPVHVVYLAWDVPDPPQIRVHRGRTTSEAAGAVLDAFFDADGAFVGAQPEGFNRLEDAARSVTDVVIGADARRWSRRIAAHAVRQLRAVRIGEDIRSRSGRLPGIAARLYPYQVEGVAFLASAGRALLADDMGLGKTLQSIAAAVYLMRNEGVRRTFIVCPASLKHQWAREIERFTGQETRIVEGNAAARLAHYRARKPFTIANYEIVLRDLSVLGREVAPDLLVLDEAQRIKNWRTKTATAIKSIETRFAFVLTGTPLENRLEDLYSVMQVIDPEVLGPLWRFRTEFEVVDERGKVLGYRNLSTLRQRLAPVMLRRERAIVRDQLPDRVEMRLDIVLSPRQQELHDSAVSAAAQLGQIAQRRPLTPSEQHRLLAALQSARMVCNAAGLVDRETTGSPKLDELGRLLESVCIDEGRKVVVFSEWTRMLEMAETILRQLRIDFVRLHGGVPSGARGELVRRFREDASVLVFLSTDAGGVGLNLQCAQVLINLDLPWNPAVLNQRIARIHRLGQPETVQIMLLVAAEAYEGRIAGLIVGKRALFDAVVTGESDDDVVGISKKTLALALEALQVAPAAEPDGKLEPDETESASVVSQVLAPADQVPADAQSDVSVPSPEPSLEPILVGLQTHFGSRLERIVAVPGGLVAVTERLEAGDHDAAEALSAEVNVAVVDARTYYGLQRLGAASPLGEARSAWERPTDEVPAVDPRLAAAERKLRAAGALLEGEARPEAMGLFADAMTALLAIRADCAAVPESSRAAVWLYGELIPAGRATAEEAGAVLRARALSEAPEVPDALAAEIAQFARGLAADIRPN